MKLGAWRRPLRWTSCGIIFIASLDANLPDFPLQAFVGYAHAQVATILPDPRRACQPE